MAIPERDYLRVHVLRDAVGLVCRHTGFMV